MIGCETEIHVPGGCQVSGWTLVIGNVPGRVVGFAWCLMELRAFREEGPGSMVFRFGSCWWSDLADVRERWPDAPVAALGWADGFWLCLGRLVRWWLHSRHAATVGIRL
jgi:hypothetical protein